MFDLVQRVNWNEYLSILAQGNPPIGIQLLVVNALLVCWWLARRVQKKKSPKGSGWMLQALFVACNIGVISWGSRLSF